MGIDGIHILFEVDDAASDTVRQAERQLQVALIAEHRQGGHPAGRMIRECPLCQRS
jgi:hypothetical protein